MLLFLNQLHLLHVMSPETQNRETRATEMSRVGSQDQSGLEIKLKTYTQCTPQKLNIDTKNGHI